MNLRQPPPWMMPQQQQSLPTPPWLRMLQGQNNVRNFSAGGMSYVPSAQRYARLAPSEQAGFQGYLEDELGVHAPDVMWNMQRLTPRSGGGLGSFGRAPRWLGAYGQGGYGQ